MNLFKLLFARHVLRVLTCYKVKSGVTKATQNIALTGFVDVYLLATAELFKAVISKNSQYDLSLILRLLATRPRFTVVKVQEIMLTIYQH